MNDYQLSNLFNQGIKQIVSFSGGIGSFCVLKRCVNLFDQRDIMIVFMDTKFEDEDLYRFNTDVFNYIRKNYPKIPIIELCDGRTPVDIGLESNIVLNNRLPLCSKKLKSALFRKWLKSNHILPDDAVIHIGIDAGETRRCPGIDRNYKHPVRYLLVEENIKNKAEMLKECADWGIEIPKLYKLGFDHNNCGGRCFRAGMKHFRLLNEVLPHRFIEMCQIEDKLCQNANRHHNNDRLYTILKRSGKPIRLTEII